VLTLFLQLISHFTGVKSSRTCPSVSDNKIKIFARSSQRPWVSWTVKPSPQQIKALHAKVFKEQSKGPNDQRPQSGGWCSNSHRKLDKNWARYRMELLIAGHMLTYCCGSPWSPLTSRGITWPGTMPWSGPPRSERERSMIQSTQWRLTGLACAHSTLAIIWLNCYRCLNASYSLHDMFLNGIWPSELRTIQTVGPYRQRKPYMDLSCGGRDRNSIVDVRRILRFSSDLPSLSVCLLDLSVFERIQSLEIAN
jgi:hypothetical protein